MLSFLKSSHPDCIEKVIKMSPVWDSQSTTHKKQNLFAKGGTPSV